jgi:tape measure domain-containing protein
MTTPSIGYASLQIIPSMRGMEARINRELAGIMPQAGRRAGEQMGTGASEGFGSRIGGMSKYAKAAAVGVGLALGTGALAIGKWGLGIASANEQAQISFETMLGSAEKASTFLDDLKDFAAKTPFEFPELQTAASSLISAGVEAGKVIPIMTSLGDVTAGMGTGSEGIKRATVALQQMQAAGKITGEDLNQLRDAGVPVFDLLAAATGKAKTEVASLAQAGKLGKTELDQLMGALESGAGLERFSGLMDKQSESLAGLGSTLLDNLGQGLATELEPTVGLLKDALPAATDLANDGISLLGDGLAAAIEAGQDFAGWIVPIGQDVADHLMPVLEDLYDIAGDLLPDALGLLGGGFVAVQQAVNPLLDTVGVLTGYLADHEEVVWAVIGAYAAWKIADVGTDVVGKVSTGIQLATTSLRDMRTAIADIAATRGVSTTTATLGVLRSTLTAPVSGGTAAGGALAGIAVGATIAFKTLERAAENGREAAKEFVDSLKIDSSSSDSMQRGLADINQQIQDLSAEADRGGFDAGLQLINPFDENTIDEAQSQQKELSKVLGVYVKDLQKVYGAASLLGESSDTIDKWVEKLDLDVENLGPKRMAWAIGEARNAAEAGTPSTDKLAESYKVLADETSTSTEKIDAWKTALDEALDRPQSLFDATTAYAEGLASFQETLTEGAWGQFGTGTEAGRKNRDALSGMIDNVQSLAGAYADLGQDTKAAEAIRVGREEIVKAGEAAGLSEAQVRDYMESLGLTEKTWKAQVELTGAGGAKKAADDLRASLDEINGKTFTAYLRIVEQYDAAEGRISPAGLDPRSHQSGDKAAPPTEMPKAGGDRGTNESRSGRRRSGASSITINTPAASARAISDELLWVS